MFFFNTFGLKYASRDSVRRSLLESSDFSSFVMFFFFLFHFKKQWSLLRGVVMVMCIQKCSCSSFYLPLSIVQQSFICSYLNSDWGHTIHKFTNVLKVCAENGEWASWKNKCRIFCCSSLMLGQLLFFAGCQHCISPFSVYVSC